MSKILEHGDGAPPDVRASVAREANRFRTSWWPFGRGLVVVHDEKLFLDWGWKTFAEYLRGELHISKGNAYEVLFATRWMIKYRPAELERASPSDGLPGHNEIARLARAQAAGIPGVEDLIHGLFEERWTREQLIKAIAARATPGVHARSTRRGAAAQEVGPGVVDEVTSLRKINEELRATNEELRAANEQLRAANEQLRRDNEELAARLAAVTAERDRLRRGRAAPASTCAVDVASLRRRVALHVHPDRGGDGELMRELNVLFDWLLDALALDDAAA